MSLLAALPIVGKVLGGSVEKIVDRLGETDRQAFEKAMVELDNEYRLQIEQVKANAEAAKHPSLFVAGARPAILWICALGISGIVMGYLAAIFNIPVFNNINMQALEAGEGFILMLAIPLLGIGTLRTAEKFRGVARENMR